MLSVGPRDALDDHAARRAVDAAHHVEEEHAQAPERDELEAARRQPVVHRARLSAPRAPRPIPPMRRDGHRQREAGDLLLKLHRTVDKSSLLLNPVQDSLDLHPVVRLREPGVCRNHHSLRGDAGCVPRGVAHVEAARPVDAQNAPTGLCKTADGFAQLPHASSGLLSQTKPTNQNLSVCWSATHRFCGGGRMTLGFNTIRGQRLGSRLGKRLESREMSD
jgi:hypothetical protein